MVTASEVELKISGGPLLTFVAEQEAQYLFHGGLWVTLQLVHWHVRYLSLTICLVNQITRYEGACLHSQRLQQREHSAFNLSAYRSVSRRSRTANK